jgi:AcrR family transcriptional regulator
MLEAAAARFAAEGYVGTTIESVAADAGVSAKTVYDAFGTKPGLLRAVWDLALKGDTSAAPVAARPWYLEILEEPDPRRALALVARNSVAVKRRIGPMLRVIRDAAAVDEDGTALWSLINTDFHANQRVIVESLAKRKALRRGLGVAKATDIVWTLNHPDVWLLLHYDRGWSPKEFEAWLAEQLMALLD